MCIVKRHEMWIAKDSGNSWRLVWHTILRRSSLKAECFTADGLLVLPRATGVIRPDVIEPCRKGGHFVGLIPRHHTDVVISAWSWAPHLIVGHHQEAVTVITALLFGASNIRLASFDAMNGALVMATRRISISIAVEVGHEATLVVQGMLQCARAHRNFISEISQESIGSQPVLTQRPRPIASVDSFPLRVEIPAQRDWFGPQCAIIDKLIGYCSFIYSCRCIHHRGRFNFTYRLILMPAKSSGLVKLICRKPNCISTCRRLSRVR